MREWKQREDMCRENGEMDMGRDRTYGKLLLLIGVFAFGLMGCAKKEDPINRIKNAGELKVASWKQDQDGTRLCSNIAESLGVSVSYVEVQDAKEALNMVEEKTADLAIGGIVTDQDLASDLSMSEPYIQEPWYVVTLRGDYSDSIAAFEGRILAVTHEVPDQAFRWTSEISDVDFVGVSGDMVEAALTQNALHGYLCLESEAVKLAAASDKIQVQNLIGGKPLTYGVVTRSEDSQLKAVIETEIEQPDISEEQME